MCAESQTCGAVTSRYTKRAVKVGPDGHLFLDCECGKKVSIPVVLGMPMTYECECGIEYDNRGYIKSRSRG